jgi:hypothetical protein
MEPAWKLTLEKPIDSPSYNAPELGPAPVKPRRRHRRTKPQLLTRSAIDGRSNAAKLFDGLVSAIAADLGGRDQLSAIELALVEAFAGAAVTLDNLNSRLLLGQQINLSEQAQAVSALVRVASRLGLSRRAKDVGPTLGDILVAGVERDRRHAGR